MTYREAIGLYESKYKRLSYGKKVPLFEDNQALADITIAQAELCNQHLLVEKEATLTLVAGQDTYTVGVGASNIPYHVLHIHKLQLNDAGCTEVKNASLDMVIAKGSSKTSGVPNYFCLIKDNTTLIFDTLPTALTATIRYTPRLNIFKGFGGSNVTTEFNYPETAGVGESTIWTTSLLIPEQYSNLLIERALCEVFPERYPLYQSMLTDALNSRINNFNGTIPDYFESNLQERQPGEDTSR